MGLIRKHNWVLFLYVIAHSIIACRQPKADDRAAEKIPGIANIKTEYYSSGDYQKLAAMAARTLSNYHRRRLQKQESEALLYLAETSLARGACNEAKGYLKRSDSIVGKLKNDSLAACAAMLKSEIAAEQVKPDSARALLDQA